MAGPNAVAEDVVFEKGSGDLLPFSGSLEVSIDLFLYGALAALVGHSERLVGAPYLLV